MVVIRCYLVKTIRKNSIERRRRREREREREREGGREGGMDGWMDGWMDGFFRKTEVMHVQACSHMHVHILCIGQC